MTDGEGPDDRESGATAPVDFDRPELVRTRFAGDGRFASVELRPGFAPDRLVCTFDDRFYPETVLEARLEIVWYENGDFTVHYHEDHESGSFDHRWDRHPSDHNARDHVHPGPDAPTPGDDVSHPHDWRDVLSNVIREIDRRQRAFWSDRT